MLGSCPTGYYSLCFKIRNLEIYSYNFPRWLDGFEDGMGYWIKNFVVQKGIWKGQYFPYREKKTNKAPVTQGRILVTDLPSKGNIEGYLQLSADFVCSCTIAKLQLFWGETNKRM